MAADPDNALRERAVAALVRAWGVSHADAWEAIMRVRAFEARLGPELAAARRWSLFPPDTTEPVVIDLTDAAEVLT